MQYSLLESNSSLFLREFKSNSSISSVSSVSSSTCYGLEVLHTLTTEGVSFVVFYLRFAKKLDLPCSYSDSGTSYSVSIYN